MVSKKRTMTEEKNPLKKTRTNILESNFASAMPQTDDDNAQNVLLYGDKKKHNSSQNLMN